MIAHKRLFERMMQMLRLFHFLVCARLQISLAENTLDATKTNFDDVAFSTYVLTQRNVSSVIECTVLCEREQPCKSIVHVVGTGFCSLHDTIFRSLEHAYNLPGARYFKAGQKDLCPIDEGFVHFRGIRACHYFSEHESTFGVAEASCISLGGHLSKLDSENERTAIIYMDYSPEDVRYHIGAHRDGPGNTWVWRDGTNALVPNLWYPANPSGDGSCADFCIARWGGCWIDDLACSSWRFMCEIDI